MAECPLPLDQLSPQVQRAVNPKAPKPARMMAARGMAPLPPRDLVTAQYALTFDADDAIAAAANKSLQDLDPRLANAVLSDTQVPPLVLGFLAEALVARDADVEKLLLNPKTPDSAFVAVATNCSEKICDIIGLNQARILQEPEIARSLSANPNCLASTKDRVIDFLVRNSVIIDGMAEFDQALMRLTGQERMEAAAAVEIPAEFMEPSLLREEERAEGEERRMIAEEDDATEEAGEEERVPVERLIKNMTTGQKVAFATKGNKQARSILLRDTNRIVALAAISAPSLTEIEAVQAANSRTVHADVIQYIAKNKDWARNYQIKNALAQNPKTPLPIAMKLVPLLQKRDQKTIMNSKNVPIGVRNLARKLTKGR